MSLHDSTTTFQEGASFSQPPLPRIGFPSNLVDDDLGKEEFGHGSSIMQIFTVLGFSRLFFSINVLRYMIIGQCLEISLFF